MPTSELIERARRYRDRIAIVDRRGAHTYADLLAGSERIAARLLDTGDDLESARVAFLVRPGVEYAFVQWGIWRAGGVAMPLALSHPAPELSAVLADARPRFVVAEQDLQSRLEAGVRSVGATMLGPEAAGPANVQLPDLEPDRRAMMIYTSGTTGRPKGVVTTHANITAQITTLVRAWKWREDDRILHVLPLHHVHGVINVLSCALWAGACCEFLFPFDATAVWERLASGQVSLFMAVPTVYRRLIREWEEAGPAIRNRWSDGARGARLMISGSAALPVPTLEQWQEITGHRLLERYGMTEIGMGLGNPIDGERRAGSVGVPFPEVEVRVVDGDGESLHDGVAGEIQVRGPQVFLEYWQRPEETAACFRDGWFATGDEGVREDAYWRILGRRSVDIIKTGGYKVSALEIEEVLRLHEAIVDAAVVGVADEDWGERVCAALTVVNDEPLELGQVRDWCKKRLAPYKAPRQIVVLKELPRNAMGKVVKPELRVRFESER